MGGMTFCVKDRLGWSGYRWIGLCGVHAKPESRHTHARFRMQRYCNWSRRPGRVI